MVCGSAGAERFLTIVAWPALRRRVEERVDLEASLPGSTEADDELWRIWQANGLDEESQLAHLDALVRPVVHRGSGSGDDTLMPRRLRTVTPTRIRRFRW